MEFQAQAAFRPPGRLRTFPAVTVLSDWAEERFPLHAYYASRRQLPGKVRAFLDFMALNSAPGARVFDP